MTNEEAINILKSKMDGSVDTSYEWAETVRLAIKALEQPEQKWIPCSERLPEEDGDYLVLYCTWSKFKPYVYDVMSFANDLYQIDEYDFIDRRGQKGWFYCDGEYGFCEDNSVYAWMPLPEPYKGEQE